MNKRWIQIVKIICAIGLILFFARYFGIKKLADPDYLKGIFESSPLISIVVVCNIFFILNFFHIPGWTVLFAAVVALGKWKGGIVTYFAAVYGCALVFLIVRKTGKGTANKLKFKFMQKAFDSLDRNPIRNMFILRVIGQTSPLLNYSLAVTNISFKHYILGTLIAIPIPIAINCYFFDFFVGLFK